MRAFLTTATLATLLLAASDVAAQQACRFSYPVGAGDTPAPLSNNHPVNGTNLPNFGRHLGADFWSGLGCTDLNQPVYAVADGEVVEIVDALGSYLDVVVIRHDVPDIGNLYSMYGHISRDANLAEGQMVTRRQQIGFIDDVLAYFSPCHLHFELLNQSAFVNGPFCNGCANAGYAVSPGYDRQMGVSEEMHPVTGDRYLHVLNDGIADNWWFFVNEFIDARVDAVCGTPDFEVTMESYPTRLYRDQPAARVDLTIRNNGTLPWTGDAFRLASTDQNQLFLDADAGYCNSPTDCRVFLGRDVQPGEEMTLSFDVRADSARLDTTQTAATMALEWTMVQEGVTFFGPTNRVEIELCERAGVERCDGVGPVIDQPDAGGSDAGSTGGSSGGNNNSGTDNGGTGEDPDLDDSPGFVRGEGACCATWAAPTPRKSLLFAICGLLLAGARRRR